MLTLRLWLSFFLFCAVYLCTINFDSMRFFDRKDLFALHPHVQWQFCVESDLGITWTSSLIYYLWHRKFIIPLLFCMCCVCSKHEDPLSAAEDVTQYCSRLETCSGSGAEKQRRMFSVRKKKLFSRAFSSCSNIFRVIKCFHWYKFKYRETKQRKNSE